MSDKPFLLLLYPGPNYNPLVEFEERLKTLSGSFHGTLITTIPNGRTGEVDSFTISAVSRAGGKLFTLTRLVAKVISVSRVARASGQDFVVATYDPLRSGCLGLLVKWIFGAKLVCEVNGDYADPANYLDVGSRHIARLKRRVYTAVQGFVLRRADAVKLLYASQLSNASVAIDASKVHVFPNRIQTERFMPSDGSKTLLTVGFPWQVKGIDISIKAFRKIEEFVSEWRLDVLGWYPDAAKLVELIGDSKQIEIRSPVKPSQMPSVIGNCSVFVLASRTESMGRVLVEAMAAGKPRIATRVGGIPTVVNHLVDGILVAPEDIDGLADAMLSLMRDSELRQTLGENARHRATMEFTANAYYNSLKCLYQNALEAPGQSS